MVATAKVFMHGRSQAIRLPKEFRLPGTEVRVRKIGRMVVLEPLSPERAATPWDAIDALGDNPFMPEGRDQGPLLDDKQIFEL